MQVLFFFSLPWLDSSKLGSSFLSCTLGELRVLYVVGWQHAARVIKASRRWLWRGGLGVFGKIAKHKGSKKKRKSMATVVKAVLSPRAFGKFLAKFHICTAACCTSCENPPGWISKSTKKKESFRYLRVTLRFLVTGDFSAPHHHHPIST